LICKTGRVQNVHTVHTSVTNRCCEKAPFVADIADSTGFSHDDNDDRNYSTRSGDSNCNEKLAEEASQTEFDIAEEESKEFLSYENF
jgi:hypothetical protein